jgi:replication-associated recombination protein RarA
MIASMPQLQTKRGYDFGECTSAMQKAIRRADARLAGFFGIELFESGYQRYLWKRLLTISAEDCAGVITQEIEALHVAWQYANENTTMAERGTKGRVFAAKAIILLCQWPKSRDADHLTILIHDRCAGITDEMIVKALLDADGKSIEIPEYALDCHTMRGKKRGRTKQQFLYEEQAALKPKQAGLFDADVQKTRL